MSQAAQANKGQIIDGRYRIIGKIADGGMATVYEALDQRLARHVAIKIMHTQLAQGPHREQFEERFRREARSAAAIANPHIVQVYDTGQVDGLDFLVMEYVHGVNLRHEMNEQGNFSVRQTIRIISEVLDGLASAHEAGVIHRDIKPENILINDRGHVEITDFGLARVASQSTLSSTGMLLGTAAYLPPETIENNQATPQGDLYAVGIVAYEMLSGSVPFRSDNPVTVVFKHVHEDVPPLSQVCPGIEPKVSDFVKHLVERSVEARPTDAGEALRELNSHLSDLSLEAWRFRANPTTDNSDGSKPTLVAAVPGADRQTDSRHQIDSEAATDLFAGLGDGTDEGSSPAERDNQRWDSDASKPDAVAAQDRTTTTAEHAGSATATRPYETADSTSKSTNADAQDTEPLAAVYQLGKLDKQPTHRWRKRLLIALLVVVLLAGAGAGGGAWWYFRGPGSYWKLPKPGDVSCQINQSCSITGADFARYEQNLKVAGIPYKTKQDYSDTVAEGHIISAQPSTVDAQVSKRGGNVNLIISQGVRTAIIPADILNPQSPSGAQPLEALKNAGFDNVQHQEDKDQYSMDVPGGAALAITPEPGSTLKHNEPIALTLSKGKMPVSMPDIVGKSKQDALAALSADRLTANLSEQWSDTVPSGQIMSASHKAGDQLHWGDQVEAVVSKGPQMVTLPDLRGKNEDEASKILKSLGLDVKLSAPLGDLSHTVRLQSPAPGQQVRLHGEDGKPTVITLTVV
ncbi:putative serine/threonine-protein kinase pknA2 [Bombiscardovia apis]|uniref:non-specific serine/threonine protein kinase n=1 Tax=Bombiscardovia apis TaxID=2932182 RepID=A0ABM8BD06_9BIFI|nr:Stk1 family PASTA domain-containing Ser/Thr kinase [Bombiscardovia apis]BDR54793.1 putative serine/threonine-protein kinase pknA2 [Bombiscardovia apis]